MNSIVHEFGHYLHSKLQEKGYDISTDNSFKRQLGLFRYNRYYMTNDKEFFAEANYTAVDSMAKALMEVKAGTADLALVDSVMALAMVGEGTDYDDMVVNLDNNFGLQEYGIAFRKGSDITEKVNAAIAELTAEGVVAEIAANYGLTDALITD